MAALREVATPRHISPDVTSLTNGPLRSHAFVLNGEQDSLARTPYSGWENGGNGQKTCRSEVPGLQQFWAIPTYGPLSNSEGKLALHNHNPRFYGLNWLLKLRNLNNWYKPVTTTKIF
ncbi:hypothetical protein RUM44_011442 [Polyplax serrata]|uniref:Uncharacterized protein n=1 Tax=Polyplax serrata TaxID=468196 RepID=A0ABR1ARW1_POLSC